MATHAHNVRLTWVVEVFDRIKDSEFLAFSPMRTVFTQQINEDLMIAKRKGISCTVRPTKIHRGRFQVEAPGVVDMLPDVVEDGVNSENLSLGWGYQEAVGEQCVLFKSAK